MQVGVTAAHSTIRSGWLSPENGHVAMLSGKLLTGILFSASRKCRTRYCLYDGSLLSEISRMVWNGRAIGFSGNDPNAIVVLSV
jgi:hypothetical protein